VKLGVAVVLLMTVMFAWSLPWFVSPIATREIAFKSHSGFLKDHGLAAEDVVLAEEPNFGKWDRFVEYRWSSKRTKDCVLSVLIDRYAAEPAGEVLCGGKRQENEMIRKIF
jgi:hypothetical protein